MLVNTHRQRLKMSFSISRGCPDALLVPSSQKVPGAAQASQGTAGCTTGNQQSEARDGRAVTASLFSGCHGYGTDASGHLRGTSRLPGRWGPSISGCPSSAHSSWNRWVVSRLQSCQPPHTQQPSQGSEAGFWGSDSLCLLATLHASPPHLPGWRRQEAEKGHMHPLKTVGQEGIRVPRPMLPRTHHFPLVNLTASWGPCSQGGSRLSKSEGRRQLPRVC